MGKKSSAKFSAGMKVRARDGTRAPEMPEVLIEGWTGTVSELTGPKASPKFIVEWDDATLLRIPEKYRRTCEDQGLLFSMACLTGEALEAVD